MSRFWGRYWRFWRAIERIWGRVMGLPGRGVIGMDGQDGQDCGYVGGTGLRLRLTMVEMGEGRGQGGSVIGQGQRAGRKDWGWLARIFLTGMDRMHGIYRMILDWRIGGGMQGVPRRGRMGWWAVGFFTLTLNPLPSRERGLNYHPHPQPSPIKGEGTKLSPSHPVRDRL